MLISLRRLLRHAIYDLRGGFLVRPLLVALALAALGVLLPLVEASWPALDGWLDRLPVLAPRDPAAAQAILAMIAGALMTVVSIVLSVLLVALTLASMQFSPRILTGFVQDRISQHTLGLFLGTFLFCLGAYPSARAAPIPVVPVAAVLGAMILALACVVWLLLFIHHIARSINVNYISDRIAHDLERVIDEELPSPLDGPLRASPPIPANLAEGRPLLAATSGYIRFIDKKRLVSLAKERGNVVRVERRVGHFVAAGTPLLRLATRHEPDPDTVAEFLGVFDIGPMRTLEQDLEFGVLQLVDIALKAISPAVNDPSTAINCIDQLSRVLVRVASRRPAPAALYRPPGVLRVALSPMSFERLLDAAVTQIRHYGRTDQAVSLRLLRALGDVASATREPSYLAALRDHARRVAAACAGSLPEEERGAIEARLAAVLVMAAEPLPGPEG